MASDSKEEIKKTASAKPASAKKQKRPDSHSKAETHLDWGSILAPSEPILWGKVHEATVTEVAADQIFLALSDQENLKRRFFVPKNELTHEATVGEKLVVYVGERPKSSENNAKVSTLEASWLEQFAVLKKSLGGDDMLQGEVLGKVKGGYSVALCLSEKEELTKPEEVAIRAFLPATLASVDRNSPYKIEFHKRMFFSVKELDKGNGGIVVSLRRFLRKERARMELECFETLKVGDKVSGVIKNVVAYGAFVDIGGVDAFLHISDFSWEKHIDKNHFAVGQKIQAQVIEILKDEKKVKISVKALSEDPWQKAVRDFAPGTDLEGVVVSIADFGAFVQLREGIEGLVHVSEISWGRLKHPSTKLQIGQTVKVRVIDLDAKNRRISLSIKALEENPLEKYVRNIPKNQPVEANILEVGPFGIVLHLEDGVIGFVPKKEISWVEGAAHSYTEDQNIQVVLLSGNVEGNQILCSIKRLSEDPRAGWSQLYKIGSQHDFKITKISEAGVEFEPEPGLHAWCPKNELEEESGRRPAEVVKLGQVLHCQVIKSESRSDRIVVSPKAAVRSETDKAYQDYLQKQKSTTAMGSTLGELWSKQRS